MKIIFSFILFIVSFSVFGQKKDSIAFSKISAIEDFFINSIVEGSDSLNSKNFISTQKQILSKYNQFISDYPNSNYSFLAHIGKASAEYSLEEYSNAKTSYLDILNLFDEDKKKITKQNKDNSYKESFINQVYQSLAKIEIENKNYSEAIKFLDKTKEYPFQSTCGNAYALNDIIMAEMYTKSYIGLKNHEKALDTLIPLLIENGLVDNSEIISTAYDILLQNYSKEDLKNKLQQSFKNLILEKKKNDAYEYTLYKIKFLDRNIELPIWELSDATNDKERNKILNKILNSSKFYALLSK